MGTCGQVRAGEGVTEVSISTSTIMEQKGDGFLLGSKVKV